MNIVSKKQIFGVLGVFIATFVAVMYLFVTPNEAEATNGIQKFIIIYGHSFSWILLAAASFMYAFTRNQKIVNVVLYFALITYAIFLITLSSA